VGVARLNRPGTGQVFYFLLTDRFANGDATNDTGGITGGPDMSGFDPTRISHFHGGDFAGLTRKLDYIRGLGATAIWITPPFVNKPMQRGSAGYHGYWIVDFTRIDPHLGTEAEFRRFVEAAHAQGLRVYLDIVVNHTADVIHYRDGSRTYVGMDAAPYRDAAGKPFDPRTLAYNGIGSGEFPILSTQTSFPHIPFVALGDEHSKGPDWLNDLTLYHNRGDSLFKGESSTFGDFGGLDDVFTENPAVVRGFIDIYCSWIERYGIDGYRIDTVRHVNLEFWQAFAPAIREKARSLGRPDFIQFGEVANATGDVDLMSAFSTSAGLDGTLDFGFYKGARDFLSRGQDASVLEALFERDALYTDHDSNAQCETTFVSNHDDGRFGTFLKWDNPGMGAEEMGKLVLLANDLLLTVRGQPAIYYGDEQGMVGIGNDMGAREDMFASRSPAFRALALLGTQRTGADDKFDTSHPFYRHIGALALLRGSHPGLSVGAMLPRPSGNPRVFAFSRLERAERVEYLVAVNASRTQAAHVRLQTCQPAGAALRPLFDSQSPMGPGRPALAVGAAGQVEADLQPLQLKVWQAEAALARAPSAPSVRFATPGANASLLFTARSVDGQVIPVRQELRADVSGGDGFAEVTFALRRASRPGQFELLGTADAPPYRVYWRPPADLAPADSLEFIATVDDLRGHQSAAHLGGVRVSVPGAGFGIRGARVPLLTRQPPARAAARAGSDLSLRVEATGTAPLEYRWLHDGTEVAGVTGPSFTLQRLCAADAGRYVVLVHDREGTAIGAGTRVSVTP
jgi:glycosidase